MSIWENSRELLLGDLQAESPPTQLSHLFPQEALWAPHLPADGPTVHSWDQAKVGSSSSRGARAR